MNFTIHLIATNVCQTPVYWLQTTWFDWFWCSPSSGSCHKSSLWQRMEPPWNTTLMGLSDPKAKLFCSICYSSHVNLASSMNTGPLFSRHTLPTELSCPSPAVLTHYCVSLPGATRPFSFFLFFFFFFNSPNLDKHYEKWHWPLLTLHFAVTQTQHHSHQPSPWCRQHQPGQTSAN